MTFSNTSKEALIEALRKIPGLLVTLRETVRLLIEKQEDGLTCDEIEVIANMRHQTASARIRELFLAGKITDSGDRRATRSAERGRMEGKRRRLRNLKATVEELLEAA